MGIKIFVIISFAVLAVNCSGQSEKNIVIVTIRDDRVELTNALSFLRSSNSKLICLNVNLSNCNHDSVDYQLDLALNKFDTLLVPSEVRPFGTGKYNDIMLLCSYFSSEGHKGGYVNLLYRGISDEVEKFQTRNVYKARNFHGDEINEKIRYHMAVNIAFAINTEKTYKFIRSNTDTVKIDFGQKRRFQTYSFDQLVEGKISKKVLEGKVVVIGTVLASDYLVVPNRKTKVVGSRKMLTSEIFANIACQVLGE